MLMQGVTLASSLEECPIPLAEVDSVASQGPQSHETSVCSPAQVKCHRSRATLSEASVCEGSARMLARTRCRADDR